MMAGVKLSEWARINGVNRQSAARWFHAGVLPVPVRQLATGAILVDVPDRATADVAIYARVSSSGQRGHLDRQVARLAEYGNRPGECPAYAQGEERSTGSPGCSSLNCEEGTSPSSGLEKTVTVTRQQVAPEPVLIGSDR